MRASTWWVRATGIGLAAGLLSGMFGVGGGVVMVPLLVAVFGLDHRRASATSLLAIVPIAMASATGYASNGNVDFQSGGLLLLGGIVGGQIGAWLLPRTPIATLQMCFALLSLATAARLVFKDPESNAGLANGILAAMLLFFVGVASGTLAGLLGVGGGIIMVPGLVLIAGSGADMARGTSLFVVIATALTASVTNVRNALVEIRIAAVAGVAGMPTGLLGAGLGQRLPERIALILFAGLLLWSGIKMLVRSRTQQVVGVRPVEPR